MSYFSEEHHINTSDNSLIIQGANYNITLRLFNISWNKHITFSVEDPKDETYWIPVNKGEPYYFVVRYYKPEINNLPQKPCN